jgi:SAM-dependent methyltransferase
MSRSKETSGDGRAPAPNFDRVAHVYRWCEYLALGPLLERTRTFHLARLPDCCRTLRQALVLGDGDGRFTAALLRQNPAVNAVAVDLSETMLRLLRDRCHFAGGRLRTLRTDVRDLKPDPNADRFDLVTTHFLLDCLTQPEVESLVDSILPVLSPGSLWLVSEFRVPPGAFGWPARLYIRALYAAFGLLTGLQTRRLPDHSRTLAKAGFVPVAVHHALFGVLTAELWQLDNPTESKAVQPAMAPVTGFAKEPLPERVQNDAPDQPHEQNPYDVQPDPEPASPSLPSPDPGVFDPGKNVSRS